MFFKVLTVIVLAVVTGMTLLMLRQRRVDAMHDMAIMHRQMTQSRQAVWDYQTRIGAYMVPSRLETALDSANVVVESMTPAPEPTQPASTRRR